MAGCAKTIALPPCAAEGFMGNIMVFPKATLLGWPFALKTPRRQDGLNIVLDSNPAVRSMLCWQPTSRDLLLQCAATAGKRKQSGL